MIACPTDDHLVRFVDCSMSLEESDSVRAHLSGCNSCHAREELFRSLIAGVRAPLSGRVDARAQADRVMARIDRVTMESESAGYQKTWRELLTGGGRWAREFEPRGGFPPKAGGRPPSSRFVRLSRTVAGLGCGILFAAYLRSQRAHSAAPWQARGGQNIATLGRDIGFQPYAATRELTPLTPGSTVGAATPITAGFRNLGRSPAFLLFFAVDTNRIVHWVAPAYGHRSDDPISTILPVSVQERILETTAVLDGLPKGPLRMIALITTSPVHVSDVEALEGSELTADMLIARFPGAEIRETVINVRETNGAAE